VYFNCKGISVYTNKKNPFDRAYKWLDHKFMRPQYQHVKMIALKSMS